MAQRVKNLPVMWETWVRFLGWEDPLEEGMATPSSILAWRVPMDRRAWRAMVHGVEKSWTRLRTVDTCAFRTWFSDSKCSQRTLSSHRCPHSGAGLASPVFTEGSSISLPLSLIFFFPFFSPIFPLLLCSCKQHTLIRCLLHTKDCAYVNVMFLLFPSLPVPRAGHWHAASYPLAPTPVISRPSASYTKTPSWSKCWQSSTSHWWPCQQATALLRAGSSAELGTGKAAAQQRPCSDPRSSRPAARLLGSWLKGPTPPRQGSWAYMLSSKKCNRRGAKEEAAGGGWLSPRQGVRAGGW